MPLRLAFNLLPRAAWARRRGLSPNGIGIDLRVRYCAVALRVIESFLVLVSVNPLG